MGSPHSMRVDPASLLGLLNSFHICVEYYPCGGKEKLIKAENLPPKRQRIACNAYLPLKNIHEMLMSGFIFDIQLLDVFSDWSTSADGWRPSF